MGRVPVVAVLAVAMATACGETTAELGSTVAITPSEAPLSTEVISTSTTPAPARATAPPSFGADTIESDLGSISFALPQDVGPDPLPMPALPDYVVGYGKWFVDCCFLKIAVQDFDPPVPDEERIGTFESNGLTWTVYDSGPRDGTQIMSKATTGALTVLVGAQERHPGAASDGSAQRTVEQVARSVVAVPSTTEH